LQQQRKCLSLLENTQVLRYSERGEISANRNAMNTKRDYFFSLCALVVLRNTAQDRGPSAKGWNVNRVCVY
jgi:hypothetical protein